MLLLLLLLLSKDSCKCSNCDQSQCRFSRISGEPRWLKMHVAEVVDAERAWLFSAFSLFSSLYPSRSLAAPHPRSCHIIIELGDHYPMSGPGIFPDSFPMGSWIWTAKTEGIVIGPLLSPQHHRRKWESCSLVAPSDKNDWHKRGEVQSFFLSDRAKGLGMTYEEKKNLIRSSDKIHIPSHLSHPCFMCFPPFPLWGR